ncbi:hypothetical protein BU16DRAFT_365210 [Lophium mytilinum]|uniref:Uncharacterized protein n=1 Tax=Lophium mytilinum TaxID=390894 RepID=A0A6A6QV77_9PEZI|nr:hypothetical protein BU16DRAFT_365210 [Lophium mytilinum]
MQVICASRAALCLSNNALSHAAHRHPQLLPLRTELAHTNPRAFLWPCRCCTQPHRPTILSSSRPFARLPAADRRLGVLDTAFREPRPALRPRPYTSIDTRPSPAGRFALPRAPACADNVSRRAEEASLEATDDGIRSTNVSTPPRPAPRLRLVDDSDPLSLRQHCGTTAPSTSSRASERFLWLSFNPGVQVVTAILQLSGLVSSCHAHGPASTLDGTTLKPAFAQTRGWKTQRSHHAHSRLPQGVVSRSSTTDHCCISTARPSSRTPAPLRPLVSSRIALHLAGPSSLASLPDPTGLSAGRGAVASLLRSALHKSLVVLSVLSECCECPGGSSSRRPCGTPSLA